MKQIQVHNIQIPSEFDGLDTFIVGGFVRDKIRGVKSEDVDLMVAGVSPGELVERGFKLHVGGSTPDKMTSNEVQQLAIDAAKRGELMETLNEIIEETVFPVFIDSLGREVALPRTEERSQDSSISGENAHKDFQVSVVDSNVESREALRIDSERRDLTINSMAADARTGEVIDHHNGIEDLQNGIIRHVSPAFAEDPLRVIRAARFSARIEGSSINDETKELMRELASELDQIPNERFQKELIKVFKQSSKPSQFFEVLVEVNALEVAFPNIAAMRNVPAGPEGTHKEGDVFTHTMMVIDHMAELRPSDTNALLAALVHDIGKIETNESELPHHHKHTKTGVDVIQRIQRRLNISNDQFKVMKSAVKHHMKLHDIDQLNESTILDIVTESFLSVDQLVALGIADAKGKIPQGEFNDELAHGRLNNAKEAINKVNGRESLAQRGLKPCDVGEEIPGERVSNLVRQDRIELMREQY